MAHRPHRPIAVVRRRAVDRSLSVATCALGGVAGAVSQFAWGGGLVGFVTGAALGALAGLVVGAAFFGLVGLVEMARRTNWGRHPADQGGP